MPAKVRARMADIDTLEVRWPTRPGLRYKLQFTARIDEPFADLPDPLFPKRASAVEDSYTLDTTPNNHTGFYRVVELGP